MPRTLSVLASLAMTAALGSAGSGIVLAGPTAEATADPGTAPAPLERLLIAIIGASASPGAEASPSTMPVPTADDRLAAHLHVADSLAGVIVVRPGEVTQTAGAFHITLDARIGTTAEALLVETAAGARVTIDLPDTAADHVTVVEVLGGPEGIAAHRVGDLVPIPDELRVPSWWPPAPGADAVALDGEWWTVAPDVATADTAESAPAPTELRRRVIRNPVSRLTRLVDASVGDVTDDGTPDLALSFRRPFQRTLLNATTPRRDWVDARGLSAHVGLFRPDDLSSIWVAGTLLRPVRRLAACTGALAVAYSTLRRPEIVAATAWAWQGFGFLPLPELPGAGHPICIDIDRDGRPDAAIVERS